ncbi:MAG: VTC domain-containing protein [Flavobacteriales bacterium]|nr:VTC domain-containing protein [Flavobacteriales bacterium]
MKESVDTAFVLQRFDPITLAEMDGVKLQDRVDTKYVIGADRLPALLEQMLPHYRLLEVDGKRGTAYRSLYFDTPDLKHYRDHHSKRTFRSKVRFREYIGSGLASLEVKRKTRRGRTDKARMRVDGIPELLTNEQLRFAQEAAHDRSPLV